MQQKIPALLKDVIFLMFNLKTLLHFHGLISCFLLIINILLECWNQSDSEEKFHGYMLRKKVQHLQPTVMSDLDQLIRG